MKTRPSLSWAVCALAVLAAACGSNEQSEKAAESREIAAEDPIAPGDQETTPGGIAGETAAMPPGSSEPETSTSSTTPAEPAP